MAFLVSKEYNQILRYSKLIFDIPLDTQNTEKILGILFIYSATQNNKKNGFRKVIAITNTNCNYNCNCGPNLLPNCNYNFKLH